MIANIAFGVCGFFKFEAVKLDKDGNETSRRTLADWFPNLITNNGLNLYMAATGSGLGSNPLSYCQVGSGSTPPAVTDTALVARIANNNSILTTSNGVASSAPYYGWKRFTYRFNEGVAAGNISEVGISQSTTGNLFSRALILDEGSPTTLVVLPDETLDVTYELRLYPPSADAAGSVTLDSIVYNFTLRASRATTATNWADGIGTGIAGLTAITYPAASVLGAVTGQPTGTPTTPVSPVFAAYTSGNYYRDFTATWGLTQGNATGGIGCVEIVESVGSVSPGAFQMQFTPVIPKDGTRIMTLTFRYSIARHTI